MQRLRLAAFAAVMMIGGLFPAAPATAEPPALSFTARTGLLEAARDRALAPWQRQFMADVARGGAIGPAAPTSAADADGHWRQLPPPNERYLHAAVYDPVRDRMIVFGGYSTRDLVNDVWALSLGGVPEWSRLEPVGTPPSPRHLASAIYDPVRDRLIVFGGLDRAIGYRDDIWALTLGVTPTWSQIVPANAGPSTRARHSAVYDPVQDRMIVFGGYHAGYRGADAGPLNDVWALALSGPPTWAELSPLGTAPIARYDHTTVYDPFRDRIVVFGGFSGRTRLDDVWTLALRGVPRWRALDPAGPLPAPRLEHTAIFDPAGDRMVVFGGSTDGDVSDTWSLSLGGRNAWTRIDAPSQPTQRWGHSAIYDPARARMIVFGGTTDGRGLSGEIWGLSLSGAPSWTNLTPDTPHHRRRGDSAVYDAARHRVVVFGGYDQGFFNDVWLLSLGERPVWALLHPSGTAPSPRSGHAAIYDPVRDRMLVFGGQTSPFDESNDVWALSFASEPTWIQLTPAGAAPPPRTEHTGIYDAANDRMVVFGGVGLSYFGDVWALSLSGEPAWTQLAPAGTPPAARFEHTAIYDSVRGRMVMFGGLDGSYFHNDVWALSLGSSPAWTLLSPAGPAPPVRAGHQAIYDPIRDRMVMGGGFSYSGSGPGSDVWSLSLEQPAWTVLHPSGIPPASFGSASYDAGADRMLVFGPDLWQLSWDSSLAPATASSHELPAQAADAAWLQVSPNPSRGDVTISFDLPQAEDASVRIFDLSGRAVRILADGILPAGAQTVAWDRRTSAGALIPPGLYFCQVHATGRSSVRRLVLTR
ncbi:MAG TPA: kelch repeat-containing protein [Candidatus Eisenbacteria bacterium]|nr:kelch repeat-containing protein [Candidatus Eisenbacteria bacterium]